jgi:F-type H+-transporting ATPase subunit delta
MAELVTLARPYARAAFEFARDIKALDRWSNMLETAATVAQFPAVQRFLGSPNFTAEQKGEKFLEICGDELDNKVSNFILYLAENHRLRLLAQVREQFELLKANHERSIDVNIASAFEISAEQQSKLSAALKQKLDRDVNLQTQVDKSLIGGILIKAGDMTIDGSVRGKLTKLAESMGV